MSVANCVKLGRNVKIFRASLVNLYGCAVGGETRIGTLLEVQQDARGGQLRRAKSCQRAVEQGANRPRMTKSQLG
jgi:hypothetical protein